MTDFIIDRKNVKWTAMMLPEHRSMLHDLDQKRNHVLPPTHDEDRLAELAEQLSRAMQDGNIITMRYWKNKRHHMVTGVIKRIDPMMKAVMLDMNQEDRRWISAQHIVDLEF